MLYNTSSSNSAIDDNTGMHIAWMCNISGSNSIIPFYVLFCSTSVAFSRHSSGIAHLLSHRLVCVSLILSTERMSLSWCNILGGSEWGGVSGSVWGRVNDGSVWVKVVDLVHITGVDVAFLLAGSVHDRSVLASGCISVGYRRWISVSQRGWINISFNLIFQDLITCPPREKILPW